MRVREKVWACWQSDSLSCASLQLLTNTVFAFLADNSWIEVFNECYATFSCIIHNFQLHNCGLQFHISLIIFASTTMALQKLLADTQGENSWLIFVETKSGSCLSRNVLSSILTTFVWHCTAFSLSLATTASFTSVDTSASKNARPITISLRYPQMIWHTFQCSLSYNWICILVSCKLYREFKVMAWSSSIETGQV